MSGNAWIKARAAFVWATVIAVIGMPLLLAAFSPLLAWRDSIYIGAGFAGIAALCLLLLQPLLAGRWLPGIDPRTARRAHQFVGSFLVALVVAHVAGLWITSPPDVIDVLLFRSPTPFSAWGAIAMWTVFALAIIASLRRSLKLTPRRWRQIHMVLIALIVPCTAIHAIMIEGTMEYYSKALLCALVILVSAAVALRTWR